MSIPMIRKEPHVQACFIQVHIHFIIKEMALRIANSLLAILCVSKSGN